MFMQKLLAQSRTILSAANYRLLPLLTNFSSKSADEETQLQLMIKEGNIEIVKLLIEKGVDVNVVDKAKRAPLHLAIKMQCTEIANLLIQHGAVINVANKDMHTPLHWAVGRRIPEIVHMLIENDADVNVKDTDMHTPLHWAVGRGIPEIVHMLIENGADVNVKDTDECTPLRLATGRCDLEAMKILIENGADVNCVDKDECTPLRLATGRCDLEAMKILIENGADVNRVDKDMHKPLHWAIGSRNQEIVRMLIENGADVNAEDMDEFTPLRLAIGRCDIEAMKILIKNGADVNYIDKYIQTPLYWAQKLADKAIEDLLRENGAVLLEESLSGNDVPNEIQQLGNKAVRLYHQARLRGSFSSNVIRCLFVGQCGVGKTTLVKNLLELKKIKTSSTDGNDVYIWKCYYNTNTGQFTVQEKHREILSGVKDIVQIDIWDFAGEMIYYTTHQTFFSQRGLYCLVFNLSTGLHEEVPEVDVDPQQGIYRKVINFLEYWIGSIKLYANSEYPGFPKIVLVGTHKDKVMSVEHIKDVLREIRGKFGNLLHTGELILREDLLLNAVDMSEDTLNLLRDVILNVGQKYPEFGEEIPYSWMELHQKMYVEKQSGKKFIYVEKIKQYNKELQNPLSEDELRIFLLLMHNLGYILYFDVVELNNLVILTPKWTIDAMKCLITGPTFAMGPWRRRDLEKMRSSGKVEQSQIEKIWKERSRNNFYKHRRHLLLTMEKLDLLCRPKVYDRHGKDVITTYYYMPCMLKGTISTPTDIHGTGRGSVEVSYIFQDVLPPAVFNRLLASCITLWQIHDGHLYHALAVFRSGKFHILQLRREFKQINVQIWHQKSNEAIDRNFCLVVKAFVTQIINGILSSFGTSLDEDKPYAIKYNEAAMFLKHHTLGEYDNKEGELIHCQDTCKGLTVPDADTELSDRTLMRIGRLWIDKEFISLSVNLLGDATFLEEKQREYPDFSYADLPFLVLHEWKRRFVVAGKRSTAGELIQTCTKVDLDLHVICKVFREMDKTVSCLSPAFQMKEVTPELLDALSDRISTTYLQLGLELGFQFDKILQFRMNNRNNTQKIVREMLRAWMDRNEHEATILRLATALVNSQSNIEELIEAEDKGLELT